MPGGTPLGIKSSRSRRLPTLRRVLRRSYPSRRKASNPTGSADEFFPVVNLKNTGQRGSDMVRLGPTMIDDGGFDLQPSRHEGWKSPFVDSYGEEFVGVSLLNL